jgi:hypothetical protein
MQVAKDIRILNTLIYHIRLKTFSSKEERGEREREKREKREIKVQITKQKNI